MPNTLRNHGKIFTLRLQWYNTGFSVIVYTSNTHDEVRRVRHISTYHKDIRKILLAFALLCSCRNFLAKYNKYTLRQVACTYVIQTFTQCTLVQTYKSNLI